MHRACRHNVTGVISILLLPSKTLSTKEEDLARFSVEPISKIADHVQESR